MYVMTPVKLGKEEDSEDFLYKKKYTSLLHQELSRRGRIRNLGKDRVTGYKRLYYNINNAGESVKADGHEADWEEYINPKHAKGMALFE
jgi:hypothetical protein